MKIFAIIVCYHPSIASLRKSVKTLINSGCYVILVENTEKTEISESFDYPNCSLIVMGENSGIAKAQNKGIRASLNKGAEVIIFFDQDSEFDDSFVGNLVDPLLVNKPCVFAPVCFDKEKGHEFPSMRVNKLGLLSKVYLGDSTASYSVDVVISSGMAITREAFDIVGLMDESFFIDFVDTEWCLRCRSKNIKITISTNALMAHAIGNTSFVYGFMKMFVHSPTRCYYQIRNSFLFLRKSHVPTILALKEVFSLLFHHFILFIFLKDKKSYLKHYIWGFRDGIREIGRAHV